MRTGVGLLLRRLKLRGHWFIESVALRIRRADPVQTVAPRVLLLSVYRRENADLLCALLEPALAAGWEVRLWALDQAADDLSSLTVGTGPGAKFDLLNRLVSDRPSDVEYVVVSDDDVRFLRGTIVSLVQMAEQSAFDLGQPSQSSSGNFSHDITRTRLLSRARETTFVEIGPLFAMAQRLFPATLPFPTDAGMGWGLEFRWMDLRAEGYRLGIVDDAVVQHLGRVGEGYAADDALELVQTELAARGRNRWSDLQRTVATWRPWQDEPPWLGG